MFPRRKNLLEAFKKSAEGVPPAAPPPVRASSSAPRTALFEGEPRPVGAFRPSWALGVIALVSAFVLGFVAGRSSAGAGETRAKEPGEEPSGEGRAPPANQPRIFQERPVPPASGTLREAAAADPGPGARIEDSALFDPANRSTVVVASYSKSKSSQDLAWATYAHLKDANLPVFPPVESRNLFVVLAGAAPTEDELTQVEEAVKALARDGQKKDYPDAYCARIDTLIPRPTPGSSKP